MKLKVMMPTVKMLRRRGGCRIWRSASLAEDSEALELYSRLCPANSKFNLCQSACGSHVKSSKSCARLTNWNDKVRSAAQNIDRWSCAKEVVKACQPQLSGKDSGSCANLLASYLSKRFKIEGYLGQKFNGTWVKRIEPGSVAAANKALPGCDKIF